MIINENGTYKLDYGYYRKIILPEFLHISPLFSLSSDFTDHICLFTILFISISNVFIDRSDWDTCILLQFESIECVLSLYSLSEISFSRFR